MNGMLLTLALIFAQLSLLAFGGGNTVLPEMQRQVVDVEHWMTARDFSAMFALAQAAPGPNMMVVTLIGWHVASWPGILVVSLATFGPSSVLTALVLRVWLRFRDRPWRRLVQQALVPVTAGLVASSAALITVAADSEWTLVAVTVAATAVALFSRLHPLWILAGGAAVGLTGWGLP